MVTRCFTADGSGKNHHLSLSVKLRQSVYCCNINCKQSSKKKIEAFSELQYHTKAFTIQLHLSLCAIFF